MCLDSLDLMTDDSLWQSESNQSLKQQVHPYVTFAKAQVTFRSDLQRAPQHTLLSYMFEPIGCGLRA